MPVAMPMMPVASAAGYGAMPLQDPRTVLPQGFMWAIVPVHAGPPGGPLPGVVGEMTPKAHSTTSNFPTEGAMG
jgi:hypothetical protein